MKLRAVSMVAVLLVAPIDQGATQASASSASIETHYQLTAHPWSPLSIPRNQYLDVLEGACRFSAKHQDADGAIIDIYMHRELQYSTPYFGYAVGTLVRAGRAKDLLPRGIAAMEHSTLQFSAGRSAIPDQHGEFFIAVLTESLDVYGSLIPQIQLETWRQRLRTPIAAIVGKGRNNWMTYSMKGEWLRATHGLVSHEEAVRFIEDSWQSEQRSRSLATPFHLYHDKSSEPDTLSVEAVGRGNLLAMIADGYDGPSAGEIRQAVEDGTQTTLLLEDPTGQVPANGRTDDHVWVDLGYQLAFQVMANREWTAGHKESAAVYQHASELSFVGLDRWKQTEGDWAGSFFITKNHFDPSLRVGYQDASHISNYTGSFMFHLAEAYNARQQEIPERPAPAEIGGYAIALDPEFDSVMANAGGMQVQFNLRGQKEKSSGNYWTPLGIVRFARAGWDSRIGPADGALTEAGGITFAPEFLEDGHWLRLASLSTRYRGFWKTELVHPALVRGIIEYRPLPGDHGPAFKSRVWITPDGVYIETRKTSSDPLPWGVTWPLLQNDGRPLEVRVSDGVASTSYSSSSDTESFLAVGGRPHVTPDGSPLRSTFGDLWPLRAEAIGNVDRTFVYPHNSGQPAPESVRAGFRVTADGFTSELGTVHGDIYIGKTIAGGMGREIALPAARISFNVSCGFLLQLRGGVPFMVETDRGVVLTTKGKHIRLPAHQPTRL